MKVEIESDLYIHIMPENAIEVLALRWIKERAICCDKCGIKDFPIVIHTKPEKEETE